MLSTTLLVVAMMLKGISVPDYLDIRSKIEVAAIQNQIDPQKMLALAECESKFNAKAWNKGDPYGGAKGLYQWLQPTWDRYEKLYGKEMDIWDYNDQIKMTAFALGSGKWSMWSCSKQI